MAGVDSTHKPFESRPDKGSELLSETLRLTSARVARQLSINPGAMADANCNPPFPVADSSDPLALLYSTPANQPLSLVRRTHGTEPLFHYYALRGYKEVLNVSTTPEAAKAVQACLEGRSRAAAGSGMAAALAQNSTPSLNDHVIDRCLVSTAPATAPLSVTAATLATDGTISSVVPLHVALRPAQAQDISSIYLTQRAEKTRAAAEQERRQRLRLMPEAAVYLSRYYPEGSHIVADVQLQLAGEKSEYAAISGALLKPGALSSNPGPIYTASGGAVTPMRSPALDSAPLPTPTAHTGGTRFQSNPGPGRHFTATKPGSLCGPSIVPMLPRTPQEAAVTMRVQQEGRHALADQIEDAFVNAYHLRDPAAAQRQCERVSLAARTRSMQAAAALLASTGAAPKRSTLSNASKKTGRKKKKTTAPVAPPKREGGVPANLEVFRTSLLLACNQDGAVTLGQLRTLLADVPFHVGTPTSTSAAHSASAAHQLFRIIHISTRAPDAADAADLLLAVASTTAAGGGALLSRHGTAVGDACNHSSVHGARNSFSRASNTAAGARRGPGASTTVISAGQARLPATSTQLHGSIASMASPLAAADAGSSCCGGAHSPKTPSLMGGTSHTWSEMAGAGNGRRQQPAHRFTSDMHDECKSVLVVEVLDALDALLNSIETKRVVRWECYNVLAGEGSGYIHRSQLAKLRRHAYRDGSVAEEQAAVTAAMVKALSDVFAAVAEEEEAAYLKANKKRRKKGGAAALAAHQSSPIPLNVMRKSHIDFATFSRFFDEVPLMAAAFAHIWLPLLLSGRRHTAAAGGTMAGPPEPARHSKASPLQSSMVGITSPTSPSTESSLGAEDDKGGEEASPNRSLPSSQSQRRAAPAADGDPNESPLELLGSTVEARQAAVRRLVMDRQEQLHQACDAEEKEKLMTLPSDELGGSVAFLDL
ncbi:hypothetical protein GH5_04866 [Leishmania sp. Ghana 2012 LV757]|uniref:hypothetical protein n=1 Tax=Leishmania sp. Ghana 2012 LV757 TaxID=2803181 RepID=UPI001B4D9173|nr:hypothetical protein GH5_04866 [Leishmania sp. Ghana 2012 LV757]